MRDELYEPITVRDATFAVLRERGIERIFANPGSVPLVLRVRDADAARTLVPRS
jgi:hypothetical protein